MAAFLNLSIQPCSGRSQPALPINAKMIRRIGCRHEISWHLQAGPAATSYYCVGTIGINHDLKYRSSSHLTGFR